MKKIVYIIATMVLGILLTSIGYMMVELAHIKYLLSIGGTSVRYGGGNCYLPLSVPIVFLFGGAVFGYILGVKWWQIVYIKKHYWRMKKKANI